MELISEFLALGLEEILVRSSNSLILIKGPKLDCYAHIYLLKELVDIECI